MAALDLADPDSLWTRTRRSLPPGRPRRLRSRVAAVAEELLARTHGPELDLIADFAESRCWCTRPRWPGCAPTGA